MKILIAADTYYPNVDGSSYFSQRLAASLVKRGHSILVIAPSRTMRTEFFLHDGVRILGVFSLPTILHKNYRFSPPFFIKSSIVEAVKTFGPDVIHIQGHFFIEHAVIIEARKLRLPVVGTNHFMPDNLVHYLRLPKFLEGPVKWLLWWQFKSIFKHLDHITTPTESGAAVLRRVGLPKPVRALSCGIDLKKFNPHNSGEDVRARYGIPGGLPVLLCVGRLAPEKHIDLIFQALVLIREKAVFHLVVVGGGMERKFLERLVRRLGIADLVTFAGFVPDEDMPAIYKTASIFIMAGTAELQSLVTMEAMASGLPVIAVNALALPELAHHGENGYLFEPGDANALAEGIRRLLSDNNLRNRMAQKSLGIISHHDLEKTVSQFEAIYQVMQKGPIQTK